MCVVAGTWSAKLSGGIKLIYKFARKTSLKFLDVSGIWAVIVGIYMCHDMQIYTQICTHTHTHLHRQ